MVGERIGTVAHADLLAFEARWPRHTSDKGERIRRELGITLMRYYVLLSRAAVSAEGIVADPVTARRVRERAERRRSVREQRMRIVA